MIKVKETELKELSKNFNNKDVYVKLNGVIEGKIIMNKVKCNYNKSTGTLEVCNKLNEDVLRVDIFMAYMILVSEDKRILEIKLDNDEDVIIEL